METNRELVGYLERKGHIRSAKVREAFLEVDRAEFVPEDLRADAYEDRPLPIGADATISAPHMMAEATEILQPAEGSDVVEVGSGSGYQAAVLSRIAASLTGVEINPDLVEESRERLEHRRNVEILQGDGLEPAEGTFDRILYACGIPEQELMESRKHLVDTGRIVAPLNRSSRQVYVSFQDGELTEHFNVRFVEKM